MAHKVEVIHDEKLAVGEGPHWDAEAQVLYYVEIPESRVFKYDPSTKKITYVVVDKKNKTPVGFVVPVAGKKDKFVIGYGLTFAILTWDGLSKDATNVETLVEVEPGTENRFNDGKVDPKGRLFAGTMAPYDPNGPDRIEGGFYSMNADGKSTTTHLTDVGISNGLTWSSDHKTFYYIDSLKYAVEGFDYDIDSGKLTNRRTIFDLKKKNVKGLPDGMTIDKDDNLWVCTFGGSAIHHVNPKTGTLLKSVQLPASQITSVAWGGPKLDELYVTSASVGETEDNGSSGRVYKITGLGTSGHPGVPVKL